MRAEIKRTGTSQEFGDTLGRYDRLLNKARDGHLGPRNLQLLQDLKLQLEKTFGVQSALDVYRDWSNAALLRRQSR
ncbi:hypothetical protein HY345_02255 [Candidatus Microgenomates bacterium]|nr:hypothetical protein [Candidatus Microgenomates bacterium]